MNPIVNGLLRLTGIAPLIGPIPLTEREYQQLFKADTSFVDYFPIMAFDESTQTFVMKDGINVAMMWQLSPADLDAKPLETLEAFNHQLANALKQLPQENNNPYIVQLFLQNADSENFGDELSQQLPSRLQDDPFSKEICHLIREHSKVLTHENGVFADNRLGSEKGWRVAQQKIFLCIYRLENEAYWKKQRKTPAQKLRDDTSGFITTLQSLRIKVKSIDDHALITWLGAYFSHSVYTPQTKTQLRDKKQLASFDLGQECFQIQPDHHRSKEPEERGILRFGKRYYRYLTTHGLQSVPQDGCLTLATQAQNSASVWEQMPAGSMMTWTITPQPKAKIELQIDKVMASAQQADSAQATYAYEQGQEAKEECMRNDQQIFYTQIGCYLSADSLTQLFERTEQANDAIRISQCLSFIEPEYDLISYDAFIRNLPCVYDFAHDRKSSLRARMTYLSHLSATLPLFGAGTGSDNLCYLMFKRNGEPFMLNPYHKEDRSRVAHQVVFGPTGSGKSATMIYLAIMSMAVNGPRQFILDKGNSFGLLADFYERFGKKVKRITFNAASKDVFPPFYETEKALSEAQGLDNDLQLENEDGEERSYLTEMLSILKIMVTGGRDREAEALRQSDINFLQQSLILGLKNSVKNQSPHARPEDVYYAMRQLADEESVETLVIRYRDMAAAIQLWTQGPRGRLFNQYGGGFDSDADLTLIETGSLTNEGNEDMFAVAGLSTLTNITALGERTQYDGRHIEVFTDEGHYWMQLSLLINGMIQATKVWRKLGIWLVFATQDFSDFAQDAKKILSQAEFWWLLSMGEDEARQISQFKDLSEEEHYLIRQAIIEKPNFTEGTMLSERFGCGLNRYIPPALILALAQTDADEKQNRQVLMDKHDCSELDAAIMISQKIEAARRRWQDNITGERHESI